MRLIQTLMLLVAVLAVIVVAGCGSDNKPASALAPFQPEIVNNPDNFQFQATNVRNVTTTVTYNWSNSGAQATVNHSSTVTGGNVGVTIYDANDSLVYTSPLVASANEPSTAGLAGIWRIVVNLTNCDGTLNFRVQML